MGRPRWKLSFHSRSAASPPSSSPTSSISAEMPVEFLCPISGTLMADPVIVPSGHTFERSCIQACAELAFTPPTLYPALDLSSTQRQPLVLIPNNALKSAIVGWCERFGFPPPLPIPHDAAVSLVRRLMPSAPVLSTSASGWPNDAKGDAFRTSAAYNGGREIEDEVWRKPEFSYGGKEGRSPAAVAATPASAYDLDDEKGETFRPPAFHDAGKNEQDGILRRNSKEATGPVTPSVLSVRTRKKVPSLLSTSTSSSSSYQSSSSYTSSEIVPDENLNQEQQLQQPSPPPRPTRVVAPNLPASDNIPTSPAHDFDELELEEDILNRLRNMEISEQEYAVAALRQATRESPERRKSLCTPRLLSALRPTLLSRSAVVQINATAAMVNLSLESANKVLIVRSGAVPPLIDVLKSGHPESRDHAAGALFSLALEEENRVAVGVLGAIPPLLALFARRDSDGARARRDAGMAVYYLSLATTNRTKIAQIQGAVRALLNVAAERDGAPPPPTEPHQGPSLSRLAMMIVCNLAGSSEGRAALMDAGAVETVLRLMNRTPVADEEHCVAALYGMSKGSLRFRGLARAAGAERVLVRVAEGSGGEVRREMAKKTLRTMRGEDDEGGAMSRPPPLMGFLSDEDGSIVSEGLMAFPRRYKDYGNVSAEF